MTDRTAPQNPTTTRRSRRALLAGVTVAAVAGAALAGPVGAASAENLVGTFKAQKGTYKKSGKKVTATGSYFRMIYPNGSKAKGPWFNNTDSKAKDNTYTLFKPGIDGGLRTGQYQEHPTPAFDTRGFALANRIVQPLPFAGINFSLGTAAKDYQSGGAASVPKLTRGKKIKGTTYRLTGDLRAFNVGWNSIYFNQGTPKANGTLPGKTSKLTGTYDTKTHKYEINWQSQIVGGPFNDFTGDWYFAGKFVPAK
ncbi:hypothetical protein AB0L40_06840 [Patulibacter sp. NPDC049589]|uniref:hypothetical protein n=1 Tax=Patulibacter sp. NPDC049589 TaxID=3154731 RepID=UPI003441E0C1